MAGKPKTAWRRRDEKRQLRKAKMELFGKMRGKLETPAQRAEIVSALLLVKDNERIAALCDFARDPAYKGHALVTLAAKQNIGIKELARIYQDVKASEGIMRASAHVPQIMEDMARDAMAREKTCWKCEGTGEVWVKVDAREANGDTEEPNGLESRDCPECDGTGLVRVSGDPVARKQTLEVMGLIGKPGGVQINQQFNNLEGGEGLESMVGAARGVLKAGTPTVVAEAEEVPSE